MVFSSLSFLLFFFPLVFLLYFLIRRIRWQNALLIGASLLFYAWGEPVYVLLLIASVLVNYLAALGIAKARAGRRGLLTLGVLLNIGLLVVFKYSGFLVSTANAVLGTTFPVPSIRLPIGISFFTFQAMSYVIDVYRDKRMVQRSFWRVLLYISFFPQLIAGPIVKYHDIEPQLTARSCSVEQVAAGLCRFLYGLAKKVLIANTLAVVADGVFAVAPSALTAPLSWLGAICYMLQIYYDFSGYSDMAIGLGAVFGFHFDENFRYPYASLGIKMFWRRWHISLSTWFREYLYIPLGGNRKGKARTVCNQFIVFAATGLWHGANLTFLIWGLFHGVLLVLESSGLLPIQKGQNHPLTRALGHLYTLLAVLVGFTLFRSDTVTQAVHYLGVMFGAGADGAAAGQIVSLLTPWFWCILLAAVVCSFPLVPALRAKICAGSRGQRVYTGVRYAASVALLAVCLLSLAADTYNPFIYFRF